MAERADAGQGRHQWLLVDELSMRYHCQRCGLMVTMSMEELPDTQCVDLTPFLDEKQLADLETRARAALEAPAVVEKDEG